MIVPIAQTLNITTDALLGYQVQSQDDRVAGMVFEKMKEFEDVENPAGSALKVCEYLAEEANKHPMNYDIILKYVQRVAGLSYYIDMEKFLSGEPEKAKEVCDSYLKEIKENNTFSEEEYCSVEKEFKEKIYIL